MAHTDRPRLLADIGATYARFAVEDEFGKLGAITALRCADYADFRSALQGYLAMLDQRIRHAAVAIATPVVGDQVRMTNYHWQFSIEATRQAADLDTLLVVNDFTALAAGLPYLVPPQRRQVGGGAAKERSVMGLLGAGSGLGVSGVIPADGGWTSLASEGGHAAFAPQDEREAFVLEYAWRSIPHVSAERLLSGSGIELIHRALSERAGGSPAALAAREITRRGVADECPVCAETVDLFCAMLGTVAANLAVVLGAVGGIFIGGAIVPRLGAYFDHSRFRARFEAMGRLTRYVEGIPTYVITDDAATFIGVAAILDEQLQHRGGASAFIGRIRQARDALSPAERRVAEFALDQPRTMVQDPILDIARQAQVSQPTVIRFCRSLGCDGLSDFKRRLASALTGTIPVTITRIGHDDTTVEFGAKVFDNAAATILQAREQLNREVCDQAIELLATAGRVEVYAVGDFGVVADEAQQKFLRCGAATVARTDPRLQALAAALLTPNDVVVAISGAGSARDLLSSVDAALAAGARVIAVTNMSSPLARRAHLTIAVDLLDDGKAPIPMSNRILHLLLVDILAIGLAMRRSEATGKAAVAAPGGGSRKPRGRLHR